MVQVCNNCLMFEYSTIAGRDYDRELCFKYIIRVLFPIIYNNFFTIIAL